MKFFRRIFRRDDRIDVTRDALDLEETRRRGMANKASAHQAIAALKGEQERLGRMRKLLEQRAGRMTPQEVRSAVRWGRGQFAEMGLSRAMQSTDTNTMFEEQLQAIEQREQAVHDLWMDLERFVRT